MSPSLRRERGAGQVGCFIWLLLLIVAIVFAWKAVPVKIASAELYDFMVEQAKFASANQTPQKIKDRILGKAKELDLPLDKKNLSVERIRDRIRMRATYTVPVEYPFYTWNWKFEHDIDRGIYYF
jgi:hypothetical protein